MKLLFSFLTFFLFTIVFNAQTQFGITAGVVYVEGDGYARIQMNGEEQVIDRTASETGFYAGGMVDMSLSEKFHLQPSVIFGVSDEGGAMFVPIMLKYYPFSGFNLQAGPQFDYTFEQVPDNFRSFGISAAIGTGYDITQKFFLEAKYSFQLNDYYTGNLDASATVNNLLVGVGYKFN